MAKRPLSPQKKKRKKERRKNTRVVTIVRLQENGGELLPNKELEKGFLERCEIPCGVICGFSKEQTYCIPPGINWPWLPLRKQQQLELKRGRGL